jgi:hypothetical protein
MRKKHKAFLLQPAMQFVPEFGLTVSNVKFGPEGEHYM